VRRWREKSGGLVDSFLADSGALSSYEVAA
jgi:hypothetical protein